MKQCITESLLLNSNLKKELKREHGESEIKISLKFYQVSMSVCHYICTKASIVLIGVDNICHGDMTGKRGENVTG